MLYTKYWTARVRTRGIIAAGKKYRKITELLVNTSIPQKIRRRVPVASIRLVPGSEKPVL